MEFKKAADELLTSLTAVDLANEIGCSVQSVKQARMNADTASRRSPPQGWEAAALRLAKKQIAHFTRLAEKLAAKR
jgi:hypothetical protein